MLAFFIQSSKPPTGTGVGASGAAVSEGVGRPFSGVAGSSNGVADGVNCDGRGMVTWGVTVGTSAVAAGDCRADCCADMVWRTFNSICVSRSDGSDSAAGEVQLERAKNRITRQLMDATGRAIICAGDVSNWNIILSRISGGSVLAVIGQHVLKIQELSASLKK